MISDGVIADSVVSFKITWKKPSDDSPIKWDQNDQVIELHTVDIYPDLKYTKATATATYFNYASADSLISLIKQINGEIDKKIAMEKGEKKKSSPEKQPAPKQERAEESEPKPESPESPGDDGDMANMDTLKSKDSEPDKKQEEPEKESSFAYTVTVYGDRLQLMDAQEKGGPVTITHRVSDNLLRRVGDIEINNIGRIWAEVSISGLLGKTYTLTPADLTVQQSEGPTKTTSLLVQVLPSLELSFTPGPQAVIPKSKQDEYLKRFSNDDSRIGRLVSKLRVENTELKQKMIKAGISFSKKDSQKNKGL